MPFSEQIKWGLGPSCAARQGVTAPAGPGQSPGLYFPNRTSNFLLLKPRFPYHRAYGAPPLDPGEASIFFWGWPSLVARLRDDDVTCAGGRTCYRAAIYR